jgi:hypothetical protein
MAREQDMKQTRKKHGAAFEAKVTSLNGGPTERARAADETQ